MKSRKKAARNPNNNLPIATDEKKVKKVTKAKNPNQAKPKSKEVKDITNFQDETLVEVDETR